MNTHISGAANCAYRLNELSDEDLLCSTKQLVGASNQVLAALLAHLLLLPKSLARSDHDRQE
jgi:hypothetical protein